MEIALLKTRFGDGGLFGARRHPSDRNYRPLMGVNRVRATREQPPGEPTRHRNLRRPREWLPCRRFRSSLRIGSQDLSKGAASFLPRAMPQRLASSPEGRGDEGRGEAGATRLRNSRRLPES